MTERPLLPRPEPSISKPDPTKAISPYRIDVAPTCRTDGTRFYPVTQWLPVSRLGEVDLAFRRIGPSFRARSSERRKALVSAAAVAVACMPDAIHHASYDIPLEVVPVDSPQLDTGEFLHEWD